MYRYAVAAPQQGGETLHIASLVVEVDRFQSDAVLWFAKANCGLRPLAASRFAVVSSVAEPTASLACVVSRKRHPQQAAGRGLGRKRVDAAERGLVIGAAKPMAVAR